MGFLSTTTEVIRRSAFIGSADLQRSNFKDSLVRLSKAPGNQEQNLGFRFGGDEVVFGTRCFWSHVFAKA